MKTFLEIMVDIGWVCIWILTAWIASQMWNSYFILGNNILGYSTVLGWLAIYWYIVGHTQLKYMKRYNLYLNKYKKDD